MPEYSCRPPLPCRAPLLCVWTPLSRAGARSPGAAGKGREAPEQRSRTSGSLLLGQRERSLPEQVESGGLLVSERSGASLSTESHLASVIRKKYLRENETVGAQEDPLLTGRSGGTSGQTWRDRKSVV